MKLDRYKIHDIDIVIDNIYINPESRKRLNLTIQTAMRHGKGSISVIEASKENVSHLENVKHLTERHYSKHLMCLTSGISYNEPEPNTFSFNSVYGACPKCNGLGIISVIDIEKIIPDRSKSIKQGAIVPMVNIRTHGYSGN